MRPTAWVADQVEAIARHPLVWVEDPYRLLEDADLPRLSGDDRYDAEDYYSPCRRRVGRTAPDDDDEESDEEGE